MNRRKMLIDGSLMFALSTTTSLVARQHALAAEQGKIRHIIHIVLDGGLSQEIWDPKPHGPRETRGAFDAIDTAIPGIQFSELSPELAKIADQLTIARTVTSPSQFHDISTEKLVRNRRNDHYLAHAGGMKSPKDIPLGYIECDFPGTGDGLIGVSNGVRHVNIPEHRALGRIELVQVGTQFVSPYFTSSDNNNIQRRRSLLEALDREQTLDSSTIRRNRSQWDLGQKILVEGIDLKLNPTPDEEKKYGDNRIGQALLAAKSLIKAGVGCVDLTIGHWDFHDDIEKLLALRYPDFDKAAAAFIDDVESGDAPETVVCISTEFGRSPEISVTRGREHWTDAHSELYYGGKIGRGNVIGSTDALWRPNGGALLPIEQVQLLAQHAAGHVLSRAEEVQISPFFR